MGGLSEADRQKRIEKLQRDLPCHRCGKHGHWVRECPLPDPRASTPRSVAAAEVAPGSAPGGISNFVGVTESERSTFDKLVKEFRGMSCGRYKKSDCTDNTTMWHEAFVVGTRSNPKGMSS